VRQVFPVGNHALQVKKIPSPVQQDAPPVWQARPPGGGLKGSASLKDGSNKFEVAAANHQQSAQRHLQNIASDVVPCNDGSSSEDEDEEGSGDGGREGGANHRSSNVLSSMMSSFSSLTKSAAIGELVRYGDNVPGVQLLKIKLVDCINLGCIRFYHQLY